jgi:hypothetical protein
MATAALLTPFLATTADRVRREVVLIAIGVVRAVALAGTAAVTAADGPPLATYAFAAVATVALALYRPAHSALLPALAKSPRDLTSANAVRGMLDSVSALSGRWPPARSWRAAGRRRVRRVRRDVAAVRAGGGGAAVRRPTTGGVRPHAGRPLPRQGFATIAGNRDLMLVTTLGVVQTFTRGCLAVLTVVVAIELLGTGEPGVGILSAAVGAGGVLAPWARWRSWGGRARDLVRDRGRAVRRAARTARRRPAGGGGTRPARPRGCRQLAHRRRRFTILARRTDETVLARTFAGFEAVLTLGVALGGLVAPLAVEALGPRGALVAVGLLAPAAVVARRRALRRLDGELRVRDADIAVLRGVAMLGALPATTVEQLAGDLEHAEYGPGRWCSSRATSATGTSSSWPAARRWLRDGRPVNTLVRGAGFGDVALLGDVPRTATVRASGEASLFVAVLRRTAFLTAVTGYPASALAGQQAVAEVRARDTARLEDAPDDELR